MSSGINIEIAGVRLAVRCAKAQLYPEPDTAYDQFLSPLYAGAATAEMTVSLELDEMPDLRGMLKIFESGHSWSLFSDDGDYYLSLSPPETGGRPAWIARFGRDFSEATVYCDRSLFAEGKDGDRESFANPVRYPLDQILLMYLLSRKEGAIIHAAGIRIDGRCYIFPGRSGAGKSTISRRLLALKGSPELLSDDRVVVRKTNGGYTAFGTPWPGEGGFALNQGFPLKGIFFLSKSAFDSIETIGQQEALERLLPVTSIPWYDREVMTSLLQLCGELVSAVPCHLLHFTPGDKIARVFDEFVMR